MLVQQNEEFCDQRMWHKLLFFGLSFSPGQRPRDFPDQKHLSFHHLFLSSNRKMQKNCTRAVNAMTCWTISTRLLANGSKLWRQLKSMIASICAPPTTVMLNTWSPWATRPWPVHSKTQSIAVLCKRYTLDVCSWTNLLWKTKWLSVFLLQLWEFRHTQGWSAQNAPGWHIKPWDLC